MSDISTYWRNKLVNVSVRGTNLTAPASAYLALFTAITDDETGTEVADATYARKAVTMAAPTDGVTSNSADVAFDPATTGFTATHGRLMDAATAGNPITKIKALAASKVVGAGDTLTFPAGELDFEIL